MSPHTEMVLPSGTGTSNTEGSSLKISSALRSSSKTYRLCSDFCSLKCSVSSFTNSAVIGQLSAGPE